MLVTFVFKSVSKIQILQKGINLIFFGIVYSVEVFELCCYLVEQYFKVYYTRAPLPIGKGIALLITKYLL